MDVHGLKTKDATENRRAFLSSTDTVFGQTFHVAALRMQRLAFSNIQ